MSTPTTAAEETMHGKWPRRVWWPEALAEAIATRIVEVREGTMARYLVELIAYDLRGRHRHSLTGWLSTLPRGARKRSRRRSRRGRQGELMGGRSRTAAFVVEP